MDKIIEIKSCKHCDLQFESTDKDLEFYEKVSPIFEGKKYSISTPTLCPDCREQRRLSFRNERKLYKRKCDATGEDIISMYNPDKNYKVYNSEFWWSDKWDSLEYGVEFDFKRGFFEQFNELLNNVPLKSIVSEYNENCEYTNICGYCKRCYLTIGSEFSENCLYGLLLQKCTNVIDSNFVYDSENLYNCTDVEKSYKCFFLLNSSNCNNCYSSVNLTNCNFCIECDNLVNQEYCIKNKKVSKKDFNIYLNHHRFKFISSSINKNLNIKNSINVLGNYIIDSNSVFNSFEINEGNNIRYCQIIVGGEDLFDCSNSYINSSLSYEIMSSLTSVFNLFSGFIYNCTNTLYSLNCNDSSYLFGCTGLKKKHYCIFNKQYTKEEYNELVPRIIEHMRKTGEWGEFFPSSISPFGYNETVAMEYFPINPPLPSGHLPLAGEKSKNPPPAREGLGVGKRFNWSDYEPPKPNVEKIISADKLPEKIEDIPDDILNWAIECEVTKKPFRIIKAELEFYRKHNLPIPRRHPDQRHMDRMTLRNPRKLFDRDCDKCGIEMKTTYPPERKEIVYCEECYEKEVY